MSAATGAPPPPPPPPPPNPPPPPPPSRRSSSFDDLPAELLLMLYDLIGPGDFMSLALVIYPTLRRHRMVPELTHRTFVRMMDEAADREVRGTSPAVARMPVELWMEIAQYLQPMTVVALVLALGARFWRFPGESSDELRRRLQIWSQRSENERKGPKRGED